MEAAALWKAARGFPQGLENAPRFPQLPQPLRSTHGEPEEPNGPSQPILQNLTHTTRYE